MSLELQKEIQRLETLISQHKTSKIQSKNKSLVKVGSSNFLKSGHSITRITPKTRGNPVPRANPGHKFKSKNKTLIKDKSGTTYAKIGNSIVKNSLTRSKSLKKYCQFYRFGKCNKSKCRYIHDQNRISPCPKYLQGIDCSGCSLNHALNPFITPNCKYYLIGNCTKKACRFLHLKKDNAKICLDFADTGYCSLGGKCLDLHVFSCPRFEKDGTCAKKGCKLKHSLPLMGDQELPIMPDFSLESLQEDLDQESESEQSGQDLEESEESELEIFQD